MARVQLIRASAALGAAVASIILTAVPSGNTAAYTAKLVSVGPNPVTIDVADDTGKIRVFRDIDDLVDACAKASLISSASPVGISISNLAALEPAVFTGDQVKRTRGVIANFTKNVTSLTTKATAIALDISLMNAVTPGELAFKAEKQLQLATVQANSTFLTAEIARLTALLPV